MSDTTLRKVKKVQTIPYNLKKDPATHHWVSELVKDKWNVLGVGTGKDMKKRILKGHYTIAAFDLTLLDRLIKAIKAINPEALEKGNTEIFMPSTKAGPLILHPTLSDNYYILAPRINEQLTK